MGMERQKTLIVLALLLAVTGCGTPGFTVKKIGATPASIVLEYTRWYGGELEAAMGIAEAHCQRYGKHAQMAGQGLAGPNPFDRNVINFNCVE